jgi:hypothetical protein
VEHIGTEENKAVVRRFIENVVSGRDVSVADDVLAPGYINLAFEGVAIAGLKAMSTAVHAAVGEAPIGSLELVAEGMRWLPGSTTGSPCRTGASERHACLRTST